MKITINCPDSTRIISVNVMGGTLRMWASQQLENAEDGLEIKIDVPKEIKGQEHE